MVAGCTLSFTDEPTTTATTTATPTPPGIQELLTEKIQISSTIQSQAAAEHPPIIEFTVTNDSQSELTITPSGSGQALEMLQRYTSDDDSTLIPYPVDPEHMGLGPPVSESAETTDCWRLPDDFSIMVEDMVFELTIEAGEAYSKRHYLFYEGATDTCFPSNEYEMETTIKMTRPTGDETQIQLNSYITSSESQHLSATARFEFDST